MNTKNKKSNKIIIETKLWKYAGWTIPFSALSFLFFLEFIGFEENYQKILLIGAMIFFIISVIWWWWAIEKIKQLSEMILSTGKDFKIIDTNIKEIKKDLKNDRNR